MSLNPSDRISNFVSLCRRMYSSSKGRYCVLMVMRMAPILAEANWRIAHSGTFVAQIPMWSPLRIPSDMSPRATVRHSSRNSR